MSIACESKERRMSDLVVDASDMKDGVYLPGLNIKWRPSDMTVDDALNDISALLKQTMAVIEEQDDLTYPQWGAVQGLAMAISLLRAAHTTVLKARLAAA